jgi:hypothetical protein
MARFGSATSIDPSAGQALLGAEVRYLEQNRFRHSAGD